MKAEAYKLYSNKQYYAAKEIYEELHNNNCLDATTHLLLNDCYLYCWKFDECIQTGKEWNHKYGNNASALNRCGIYNNIACAYLKKGDKENVILWLEKCIDCANDELYVSYFQYKFLGECYHKNKNYSGAEKMYKKAIAVRLREKNMTQDDVSANRVTDKELVNIFYNLSILYRDWEKEDLAKKTLILSKKCK